MARRGALSATTRRTRSRYKARQITAIICCSLIGEHFFYGEIIATLHSSGLGCSLLRSSALRFLHVLRLFFLAGVEEPHAFVTGPLVYNYPVPPAATKCKMDYSYDCKGSITWHSGNTYAGWTGADGTRRYWEDMAGCDANTKECACDKNDAVWREMKGTLTSATYSMAAFPPRSFSNGDTGDATEEGKLLLGKLMCNGI